MLSSIIDAFKVPELRKKILFTLAILALYRFGAYVPVPGIPFNEFANSFQDSGVSMTMLDLFTGGALSKFLGFLAGHHALHHGIDHHAADAGRHPRHRALG